MTNITPIRRERTLAHVLLELDQADRSWRKNWDASNEGALLDRVDALRSEARRMAELMTGVSFEQLERLS